MGRRILFTVLDWGLGHATRSIPIIRALLAHGYEVVIASDSMALDFLRNEFPHLKSYELNKYDVTYTSERLLVNAARNTRRVFGAIRKERDEIEEIIVAEKISAIITDNRYGCYHEAIPSVIITHQLKFRTGSKVIDRVTEALVRQWLQPFDRIWIPDDPKRTLSGHLSMSNDRRMRCIGWQSTLSASANDHKYAIAAVISGPEPQRSNLEKEVRDQLSKLDKPSVVVRGVRGSKEATHEGNIIVYDFMDRDGIARLMSETEVILCRTGYSSVMDLHAAGKKAILIPTPAQPEQLYLGEYLSRLPVYCVQQQGCIDIEAGLSELAGVTPPAPRDAGTEDLFDAILDLDALIEKA